MALLYDYGLNAANGLIKMLPVKKGASKLSHFINGQKNALDEIRRQFTPAGKSTVIWMHAASMGEYAVLRPLMQEFRKRGECSIALTFFSPTGYDHFHSRPSDADYVFYLPLDTRRNAAEFLDIIRPDIAIFAVSEYWLNYLRELRARKIPTFLVAAKMSPKSQFFKWYGAPYRQALDAYTHIFAIDDDTKQLLGTLGYDRCSVSGNPLFDNAWLKTTQPYADDIIQRFAQSASGPVFIAGSMHADRDLSMTSALANARPGLKCIIVPHEITPDMLRAIKQSINSKCLLHSECTAATDFSGVQALVVDFVGALAYIYRFGAFAYIGGGFTPYLHSLIEAVAYGLPVACGPRIERKITPRQLAQRGIGTIVATDGQMIAWADNLIDNTLLMAEIKEKALAYVGENLGSPQKITSRIIQLSHDAEK